MLKAKLLFSTGPEEKGIETHQRNYPRYSARFSTGPEEKGIETRRARSALARSECSALALKKKGLRLRLFASVARRSSVFSTGPEEKGIETACRHDGPSLLVFSTGPEEKGIETRGF